MQEKSKDKSSVSIIIPNLNSDLVDKTLDSLFQQTAFGSIVEILVIGQDAPNLVTQENPVRFIPTESPVSAPIARNIGLRLATGDTFAFIDADCVADPRWLENLLFAQDSGQIVVGGSVAIEPKNYWQLCYNLTMFHEFLPNLKPAKKRNLGTLNLCVKRNVVENVGLFDESLTRGQDTDWTLRMRRHGFSLNFAPKAIVYHYPNVSGLVGILKLWYKSGYFNSQVRLRHKDLIATLPFQSHPVILQLMAPLVGFVVTARIFACNASILRYFHTIPVIYLTKVAWCLGASRSAFFSKHAS